MPLGLMPGGGHRMGVGVCGQEVLEALDEREFTFSDVRLLLEGEGFGGHTLQSLLGSPGTPNFHEAIASGCSLVLLGVDRVSPTTCAAIAELQAVMAKRIHANAYLSPPKVLGANWHSDDHDVVVLQLAGRKEWRLRMTDREVSLVLEEGEVLYLRRGLEHAVRSLESMSLHITFGIGSLERRELAPLPRRHNISPSLLSFRCVGQLLESGPDCQLEFLCCGRSCAAHLDNYSTAVGFSLQHLSDALRPMAIEQLGSWMSSLQLEGEKLLRLKRILVASGCAKPTAMSSP
jgi:Cupin superfamily protein